MLARSSSWVRGECLVRCSRACAGRVRSRRSRSREQKLGHHGHGIGRGNTRYRAPVGGSETPQVFSRVGRPPSAKRAACMSANANGPAVLAAACALRGVALLTFFRRPCVRRGERCAVSRRRPRRPAQCLRHKQKRRAKQRVFRRISQCTNRAHWPLVQPVGRDGLRAGGIARSRKRRDACVCRKGHAFHPPMCRHSCIRASIYS